MEDFNSETDSDYTSYWRDWVGARAFHYYSLSVFLYFSLDFLALSCACVSVQSAGAVWSLVGFRSG